MANMRRLFVYRPVCHRPMALLRNFSLPVQHRTKSDDTSKTYEKFITSYVRCLNEWIDGLPQMPADSKQTGERSLVRNKGMSQNSQAKPSLAPVASKDEPVVHMLSPMPPGYMLVPKGYRYLTRNCRLQTQQAHKVVYNVIDDKKKQIGIRVPSFVYTAVLQSESATRAERRRAVVKRDEAIEKRFSEAILAMFPRVPQNKLPVIIRRATAKHKGRVGRRVKMEMLEKARLAVQAHIRHKETGYDELLSSGTDRQDARALVRQQVTDKLKEWGPIPEATKNPILTKSMLELNESKDDVRLSTESEESLLSALRNRHKSGKRRLRSESKLSEKKVGL